MNQSEQKRNEHGIQPSPLDIKFTITQDVLVAKKSLQHPSMHLS